MSTWAPRGAGLAKRDSGQPDISKKNFKNSPAPATGLASVKLWLYAHRMLKSIFMKRAFKKAISTYPLGIATIAAIALTGTLAVAQNTSAPAQRLPRTANGKPNLEGIWQASSTAAADLQDHVAGFNMPAGRSVVNGGVIPYQPWAAAKKAENFRNRQKADPLNQCFIPGVPRIMYLDFPFQIFQTPQAVAIVRLQST